MFGRIDVQSRQIHPDLSLVICRQQEAVRHAKKKEHVLRVQVLVNTGRKDGTTREVSSVFGMTAQFVVTVVADGEEIVLRSQTPRDFANEVVHFAIFFAVLRPAHRVLVRDFVGPKNVENEHVDRRIVEPLPRLAIDEGVGLERGRAQVFVVQRIDKGVRIEPIQSVIGCDDESRAQRRERRGPGRSIGSERGKILEGRSHRRFAPFEDALDAGEGRLRRACLGASRQRRRLQRAQERHQRRIEHLRFSRAI